MDERRLGEETSGLFQVEGGNIGSSNGSRKGTGSSSSSGRIVTIYTNKMHALLYKFNNVLTCIHFYMFRPSLVHHHGVYSCIKQSLDIIMSSKMWNCRKFISG